MTVPSVISSGFIRINQKDFRQLRSRQAACQRHILVLAVTPGIRRDSNSGCQLNLAGHPVIFQSCSRPRLHQGTIILDSFPESRGRPLVAVRSECCIVVRNHLDFSFFQTHAAYPLPDVAVHVLDAKLCPVMPPGCRTGTGKCTSVILFSAVCVLVAYLAFLIAVAVIASVAVVATRHRSILPAPEGNAGPFCHRPQVESRPLCIAGYLCLVEIDVHIGVSVCQGVGSAVDNHVLILRIIEYRTFHLGAVLCHTESRMDILAQSSNQVTIFHLVDRHINGRHIHVIQKNHILASRNLFYSCCKLVVISHDIKSSFLDCVKFKCDICHVERYRLLLDGCFLALGVLRVIIRIVNDFLRVLALRNLNLGSIPHSQAGSHHAELVNADVDGDRIVPLAFLQVQHQLVSERDFVLTDGILHFRSFIHIDYIHYLLPPILCASW